MIVLWRLLAGTVSSSLSIADIELFTYLNGKNRPLVDVRRLALNVGRQPMS